MTDCLNSNPPVWFFVTLLLLLIGWLALDAGVRRWLDKKRKS